MNLFNKQLTTSELMHFNSIMDGKGMDTDIMLLQQSLSQPIWNPFQNKVLPSHSQVIPSEPQNVPANEQDSSSTVAESQDSESPQNGNVAKKNKKRIYIQVENANIRPHKHKFREGKTKKSNESVRQPTGSKGDTS